jgi:hypothetical protein
MRKEEEIKVLILQPEGGMDEGRLSMALDLIFSEEDLLNSLQHKVPQEFQNLETEIHPKEK